MNYITSCFDCNSGKSDRLLSDDSVVTKQRAQLEELNVRREQLEMMLQWREGLKSLDEELVVRAEAAWAEVTHGWMLHDGGRSTLRKLIKQFGIESVLNAIDTAANQYFDYDGEGDPIEATVHTAWSKIGGICRISNEPEEIKRLYYARGILRRRVYVNERYVMELMKSAVAGGMDVEEIVDTARNCRNWTEFQSILHTWTE
jgi:hypothetical protein